MSKNEKASLSLKSVIVMAISLLVVTGIVVTILSTKMDTIKVMYADGTEVLKSATTVEVNNNEENNDTLDSILEDYKPVTEKVIKEEESIPYEVKTKDLSSGAGETKESIVQKGAEGLKEILYKVTVVNGNEEAKVVIAENIVNEPVDCVKVIKNKEVPVVTSRSSNSLSENNSEDEGGSWSGKKLSKSAGVVKASETPSGYRETYYNLNMNGCLRAMGLDQSGYSVRGDGVKTYNGYVMVASPNLSKYPKGSHIQTTLGMGLVVDYCPSGALDIAVTW